MNEILMMRTFCVTTVLLGAIAFPLALYLCFAKRREGRIVRKITCLRPVLWGAYLCFATIRMVNSWPATEIRARAEADAVGYPAQYQYDGKSFYVDSGLKLQEIKTPTQQVRTTVHSGALNWFDRKFGNNRSIAWFKRGDSGYGEWYCETQTFLN